MKIHSPKFSRISIRRLPVLFAVAGIIFLAGCVVQSVYPFYTAKDLAFEPALIGRWSESVTNTGEYWNFEKSDGQSYGLTTISSAETNYFQAHLFRLKQFQFLDLRTTNTGDFQMPLHLVLQVSQINPTFKASILDYDWLKKLVEKNPGAIRHIVVPENPDNTNSEQMVYLTADTKELQKFILKYADDTNAFSELQPLTRQPRR